MLGADTFISAALRIVGTVAVLAAVYFFIVKPVLHTTESVSRDISRSQSQAQRQVNRSIRQANIQSRRAERRALRQAHHAIRHAEKSTRVALPPVIRCIQRANGDVTKIQACSS